MNVPTVKYCEKCGKKISDANSSDWYAHIRIKYCEECKIIARRQNAAARIKKLREQSRLRELENKTRLQNLELENEILRNKVALLMGDGHV